MNHDWAQATRRWSLEERDRKLEKRKRRDGSTGPINGDGYLRIYKTGTLWVERCVSSTGSVKTFTSGHPSRNSNRKVRWELTSRPRHPGGKIRTWVTFNSKKMEEITRNYLGYGPVLRHIVGAPYRIYTDQDEYDQGTPVKGFLSNDPGRLEQNHPDYLGSSTFRHRRNSERNTNS